MSSLKVQADKTTEQPVPKKSDFCVVSLAPDGRAAEIKLRGYIGDWRNSTDDIDSQLAGRELDTITVRINSLGGIAYEGIGIYNLLRVHPARVIIIIEGVAGSAASVVAMAGDEIRMYANTLMMIHGARAVDEWGDVVDSPEARAAVEAFNAAVTETYKARTGKSDDELAEMLATDTWMTARQALAGGWIDFVEELTPAAVEQSGAGLMAVLASATNIPQSLLASALEIPGRAMVPNEPAAEDPTPAPTDAEGGDPVSAAPSGQDGESIADPQYAPAASAAAPQDAREFAREVINASADAGLSHHAGMFLDAADIAAARAAIGRAGELKALCEANRMPGLADSLIRAQADLATAKRLIHDARAEADAALGETSNHQRQPPVMGSKPAVSLKQIYSTLNGH